MSMRREKRKFLKSSNFKRFNYHFARSQSRWEKRKRGWSK